ncbi:hypothetical protein NE295_03105 [Levilactobacillus brevis]|nr:hypothetical protein [Levilactobacillus brevis]
MKEVGGLLCANNYYYTARLTLADTSLAMQLNVTKNANLSELMNRFTNQ